MFFFGKTFFLPFFSTCFMAFQYVFTHSKPSQSIRFVENRSPWKKKKKTPCHSWAELKSPSGVWTLMVIRSRPVHGGGASHTPSWANYFKIMQFFTRNLVYCKFPKYLDTQKFCCNHSKIWTMWLYHRVMSPNDAGGIANSVDPDHSTTSTAFYEIKLNFLRCHTLNHPKYRSARLMNNDI